MPAKTEDLLDVPIWGAKAIAKAAGLFKKDKKTGQVKKDKKTGEPIPDDRKGFYLIEIGAIRAKHVKGFDKDGNENARGQLVSTQRLINQSILPDEA
jgi:hypothetical protein